MNNKGSIYIYVIMLAITIIVLALALAPAVSESTESARNATVGDVIGMDCNNASISDFNKAACVATDLNLFYFIAGLFFIAGGLITAKIIFR